MKNGITDYLVKNAMPLWEQYLEHPFIQQIIDGTLPREKFKRYIIQDTLFIKVFSKIYAYGFINTEDIHIMREFYRQMSVITGESLLHQQYLEKSGLTEDKALSYDPEPETAAYADFMLKVAKNGTSQEALNSLMPCNISYSYIGKYMLKEAVSRGTLEGSFYQPWIERYGGEEYDEYCRDITVFCDKICEDLSKPEIDRIDDIFQKASLHELEFWTMANR